MIIMHLFKIYKQKIKDVTEEIENYFEEIGLLKVFSEYRKNFNIISGYYSCKKEDL
jgi:hypothetical protein